jgi:hypothetical protein
MTKHVAKGATVDATEVTATNLPKLVETHNGTLMESVRQDGVQYATFEGPDGTFRVNVGDVFIVDEDGTPMPAMPAETFARAYRRP